MNHEQQSTDFSVIVQGPILSSPDRPGERHLTIRCLASIRAFFPGAEIVLSTWQKENTDGLDYDLLVKSEDPGAVAFNDQGKPPGFNNTNRQIVSTRAGLAAATRPYAVKFRGDVCFESSDLLRYSGVLGEPLSHSPFRSRVLITNRYTRNPRRSLKSFHYSDLVQVGRTEDLRKYWSAPLVPEPETTRWLEGRKTALFVPVQGVYMRLVCEQYLALHLLATTGRQIFFDHPHDISCSRLILSERFLLDNFYLIEPAQIGVRLSDRLANARWDDTYTSKEWESLSRAYRHPLTRWIAQADLLVKAHWIVVDYFLQKSLGNSPLQKFPPYVWLRDCYRRFMPLP